MEYTKGEWKARHPINNDYTIYTGEYGQGITQVATISEMSLNAEANAHLIAASPNLLGVVQQFIRYCEQWQQAHGDFTNGDGRTLILKNAREALSQAEGK